ncbi:pentatricopeptide repeat-containing protein At2g40720-like [Aristolochia californica]|uniref:pentatricopeptide repeat-containing protein At2g40720-like n=1 Tax=Aristolochia californica TaxID=171875 RepID=UPI0035DE0184
MQSFLKLDKFAFPSLLRSCAAQSDLNNGKKIHAAIIAVGLQSDCYISSALINMYVKCRSLEAAINVFANSPNKDVTVWNSMIDGYLRFGFKDAVLSSFSQMQAACVWPDPYSLSIMLGTCTDYASVEHGKEIHCYIIRHFFLGDPFLGLALIEMYSKCKRPLVAFKVFDGLEHKNIFIWNSMIGGFGQNGLWEKSLELFILIKSGCHEPGSATFSSVITSCSLGQAVVFGKSVHGEVIKVGLECEPYVCTSLLTMYAKFTLVEDAYTVFSGMPNKGVELCNAMISAYLSSRYTDKALTIYTMIRSSGLKPDSFTITNVLSACCMWELLDLGKQVHAQLLKSPVHCNMAVESALLTMYAKLGLIEDANSVFVVAKERDLVFWGSMIMGFCHNGKVHEALDLYKTMETEGLKADAEIMSSLIGACGGLETVQLGSQIQGLVTKNSMVHDIFVGCALIDMYSKCKLPELAKAAFRGMTHKNLVAWNSMISCCYQNGQPESSISFFAQILEHGLVLDSVSVTTVLTAISSLATLTKGKMIHGVTIRRVIQSVCHVDNALIDMYIKCGSLEYARRIFDKLLQRNIVAWNSMIAGYGSHGQCPEAIGLFKEMQRVGEQPDGVTFLSLISSCSHCGLVEEGINFFRSMSRDYRIVPQMEHFANMVDLWGRAGYVIEAYNFIQSMPTKPDKSIWLCFLFACTAHHQFELGEVAACQLLKLEPERSGNYVQLLTLYGKAGLWRKAANLRLSMKERGLKKNPGCSWIELKNEVTVFSSGNSSSAQSAETYAILESIKRLLNSGLIYIVSGLLMFMWTVYVPPRGIVLSYYCNFNHTLASISGIVPLILFWSDCWLGTGHL